MEYHGYYKHNHLIDFDDNLGKSEFVEKINTIFKQNDLAYKLNETGQIERLSPPVIGEELKSMNFNTGDNKLDQLLEKAREKYFSPNLELNKKPIKELWDAWERIKSLNNASNKKQSAKK